MKKYFFIFILFNLPTIIFGQFVDDFSDGNFSTNPEWTGNVGNFEIDNINQLHLKDTTANTSYLSTESRAIINGIWDGTSENGLQLNTGIYIVFMEVFSENGEVEKFKNAIVLSR